MISRPLRLLGTALALALALSGCDTWLGDTPKPPLPGKRIAVLSQDQQLKRDASFGTVSPILLPPPEPNDDWPQAGGYANHAMQHMVVDDKLKEAWSTNVGTGSGDRIRLLAQPVVAQGHIFAMDAADVITALDTKTGNQVWQTDISPEDTGAEPGGGLAYAKGRIFVGTGFAQVVALDAKTGKVVWRAKMPGPVRGAPTVRAGRVFAITVDNELFCLAARDGEVLWTQQGTPEQALLLGGNSPAVDGDVVVVPYSSGELYALRVENGTQLWQDSLSTITRTSGTSSLTDIDARPVIDRGNVYAIGYADTLVDIDLRTGRRRWDRQIGGIRSPWIAGNYLFLVDNNNEALAIDAKTGQVVWVTQLQTWENPAKKQDRVVWTGPVLASDRLIFGSSSGYLVTLSPYTGAMLGEVQAPGAVKIPPVVAGGTLYVLTDDADLVAYR